jgi:hypothetical protein
MTDRELLELAAKAAGIEVDCWLDEDPRALTSVGLWNPLTDDGDAFRLMVSLRTNVHLDSNMVDVDPDGISWFSEAYGTDPYAATRRAIVRAAAEIGKGMK